MINQEGMKSSVGLKLLEWGDWWPGVEFKLRRKLLINIINLIRFGSQLPPSYGDWTEANGYFVNDSEAVTQSAPRYYRRRSKLLNS